MVQLGNRNQEFAGFPSLIVSLCLLCGMIFALLGIKFPWFKRRLIIDQNITRNGATTGDRRSGQGGTSENNAKDAVSLKDTEIHWVFRKHQEDELIVQHPVISSSIQVTENSHNLILETQTSETNEKLTRTSEESQTLRTGDVARLRRQKERRSSNFESFVPPTRIPPRPPTPPLVEVTPDNQQQLQDYEFAAKLDLVATKLEEFAAQFEKVDTSNKHNKTNFLPLVRNRLSFTKQQLNTSMTALVTTTNKCQVEVTSQLSNVETTKTVNENLGAVQRRVEGFLPIDPNKFNETTVNSTNGRSKHNSSLLSIELDKFKDLNEEDDIVKLQETTVNSANGRSKCNSLLSIEPDNFQDLNENDDIVRPRETTVNTEFGRSDSFLSFEPDKFEDLNEEDDIVRLQKNTVNSTNGRSRRNSILSTKSDKFEDPIEDDAIVRLRETTVDLADRRIMRDSFSSIEPDKFKDLNEEDDILRRWKTTVNSTNGRGKCNSFLSIKSDKIKVPDEANEQGQRTSYVKYEEVDKIEDDTNYFINKWDILALNNLNLCHTFEEGANGLNYESSSSMAVFEPPNTLDLFENREHTNVERTVEHLFQVEQHNSNNAQAQDSEFRQNRQSNELHEADILADLSLELTELEKVVTTPIGYGKNIDEDWENFDNLSVMETAEQIFEPRMEQIDTDLEVEQFNAIFRDLEMPDIQYTRDIEEEGATALVINEIQYQDKNINVFDTKLPDYDSIMEHDTSNFLLPDYEDAMKNETQSLHEPTTSKQLNTNKDLHNEMLENKDTTIKDVKDIETNNDNVVYIPHNSQNFETQEALGSECIQPIPSARQKITTQEILCFEGIESIPSTNHNITTQEHLYRESMQQQSTPISNQKITTQESLDPKGMEQQPIPNTTQNTTTQQHLSSEGIQPIPRARQKITSQETLGSEGIQPIPNARHKIPSKNTLENLSVMESPEQIFEPTMEQMDTTFNKDMRATNLEVKHFNATFLDLEMPDIQYTRDIEEEGAAAFVINEIQYQDKNVNVIDTKLPDCDSSMKHNTSNYLLPDYKDAIKNKAQSLHEPSSLKKLQFANSNEVLCDESFKNEDTIMQNVTDIETNNDNVITYKTNLDEVCHDLIISSKGIQQPLPTNSCPEVVTQKLLISKDTQKKPKPNSTQEHLSSNDMQQQPIPTSRQEVTTQKYLGSEGMQQQSTPTSNQKHLNSENLQQQTTSDSSQHITTQDLLSSKGEPIPTNSNPKNVSKEHLSSKGMQPIPISSQHSTNEGDITSNSTINPRRSIMRHPTKQSTRQTKQMKVQFGNDELLYYQPVELESISSDEEGNHFKKTILQQKKHLRISKASSELPSTKFLGTQNYSETHSEDSDEEEWLASGQEYSSSFIRQRIKKLNRSVVGIPLEFVRAKRYVRTNPEDQKIQNSVPATQKASHGARHT